MGKPKNKSKKGQNEDVSDDDITDPIANAEKEDEESVASHKQKAKKKGKGRKKDEDWEDDVASEIAAMSLDSKNREMNGSDENTSSSQGKNKKKKSKVSSDNEEDADEMETEPAVGKTNKMSAFQLLMENDDDNEDDRNSDEEQQSDEETASSQPVPEAESQKQNKKKNKKKDKKKNKDEDEDIDAILADIETKSGKKSKGKKNEDKKANEEEKQSPETQEEKVQPVEGKVVSIEDFDDENDDDYKKKKKNKKEKKAKEETEDKTNEIEIEEDGEEGSTVKTAAQKRKEKREREKLKKQQEKKKKSKGAGEEESTDAAKPAEAEVESTTKNDDTKEQEQEEEDEGKGKKKKKKGEKEEKKKKPKAAVAALKAQLEKMKEEEERLRLEEEERIRKEEEAIRLKKEKERLLAEKKEREKQKKKEKIERQKKEGTYLTEKQKQERKRQLQMLEQMKAMGIQVPNKDDAPTRRPVYAKKKKPQKTDLERSESQQEEDADAEKEEEPSTQEETEVRVEETTDENVEDKVEEQEEHSEDEIAEAWDADAEVETEEDKEHTEKKEEKEKTKDTEESVEEDEDEEDDEEESEEEESDEEEDDETESSSEEESDDDSSPIEKAREKIQKRHEEAEKNRSVDNLRAPVVCVLGHVDTGKTKILDKLRRTHVQDGEAGGITQQIGATNVPETAIKEQTKMCKEFAKKELKLPGLLIIDTPGHESFGNLRSRGSSLCDIAILVVDIMHGLEPQTIESINLLKERKTPFVIALNKIDRLYQWKPMPQTDVANVIKKQSSHTKSEFDTRSREVITQIAEQGLNTALFYENKNPKEYISMVPTSAHSGDGMGNLIATICELSQSLLAKRLSYSEELQATVMEVKALHGLGTTVDVILVNGKIREGDTVIMPGTEGPIVTQVRGLLMPQPMKELRVKSQWEHHKEVKAAQGVKVIAKDLEKTLAGLPMYIAESPEEVEYYKEELSQALKEALSSIKLSERGVFVQASTLGSLEALLEFLRTSDIPYAGINIGPVHKKDIMKASIMLEHDSQYAVILAFDVKVEREAQDMADSVGVKIFTADIIYHLFDKFMAYRDELKKKKQEEFKHIAVFPCKVRILPQYIFNSRDPIVCGVQVEAGFLKKGTPLCVPSKEFLEIGRVVSIENNHNPVDIARKGTEICIKIEPLPGDTPKMIGRHFEETDQLVSKISRESIDAVKDYFREDMTKPDWQLMVELKKTFKIL